MDKELFRNGSGYVDITAYKALSNIEKENNKMEFNRGEIFEYEEVGRETYRKALIISAEFRANDRFQSVILLTEEPKGEINVPIVCEGMMYADCGMVSFATVNRIGRYIRTATAAEMAQIDECVAKCLGIERVDVGMPLGSIAEAVEPIIAEDATPISKPSVTFFSEELATAKAEAKIFKDLYENLLAKVMG